MVEEVIDRTNDLRAQAGSAPLTANAALSAAAQQRAQELAQQRTPSSVRTDGTYWSSVLTQQGLDIFRMSVREFQGSWTSPDAAIFADFVRNSYGDTPTDSTYTLAGRRRLAQGEDGLYYFSMIVADTLVQGNSGPQEGPGGHPRQRKPTGRCGARPSSWSTSAGLIRPSPAGAERPADGDGPDPGGGECPDGRNQPPPPGRYGL